jgi:hypothetical protein
MGKFLRSGYARLDEILETRGEDWMFNAVISPIADGANPREISENIGIPYVVLKGWIEQNCTEEVELAKRARADVLVHGATSVVLGADPDSVQVARLQSDHLMKLAGKLNRREYGEKVQQEISGPNGGEIKFMASPVDLIAQRLADIALRLGGGIGVVVEGEVLPVGVPVEREILLTEADGTQSETVLQAETNDAVI